jgi:GNAT superfamily N-acetyltransferase
LGWPTRLRAEPAIDVVWRGGFTNAEVNELHAEAFETKVFDESAWDWRALTERHSLGWATARDGGNLVGFANVLWDGLVHAWIQDVMVARSARRRGIGLMLVRGCRDHARNVGCEFLHVDFEDHLRDFYIDACGFKPTNAGLIELR